MILYVIISIWVFILVCYGAYGGRALEVANAYDSVHLSPRAELYRKKCNWLAFLTLFVLWGLTAFRAIDIGNDTDVYVEIFKIIARDGVNLTSRYELGYQYLCLLVSKISLEPHFFLAVVATIMYLGCGYYIFRYSKNTLLSVCLFFCCFFTTFTSMLRQGIAMMVVLYAYQAIKEKKYIKAVVLMLLGCSFHVTAIVCLAFFLRKFIPKKFFMSVGISVAVIVLSIAGMLTRVLLMVSPSFSHYFQGQYASSGWLAVSYEVCRAILYLWIVIKSYGKLERNVKKSTDIIVINFTLLLLINSAGFVMNLFTRLGQYFLLISVVEIPNAVMSGKINNRKLLAILLGMMVLAYFLLVLAIRPEWQNVYPYHFAEW